MRAVVTVEIRLQLVSPPAIGGQPHSEVVVCIDAGNQGGAQLLHGNRLQQDVAQPHFSAVIVEDNELVPLVESGARMRNSKRDNISHLYVDVLGEP